LRKLVETGFGIYLDDRILRVCEKTSDKTVLEGCYEKPNWVIRFKIDRENLKRNNREKYCCKASIYSPNELPKQLQTNNANVEVLNSEGVEKRLEVDPSAIGREDEKLTELETDRVKEEHIEVEIERVEENSESTLNTVNEWDTSLINSHTTNINELEGVESLGEILIRNPLDDNKRSSANLDEAMTWHVRLGYVHL